MRCKRGSPSSPPAESPLLEVLDRLIDQGVAVRGELWLTVADVDLVFVGLDLVIASPDHMARGRAGALAMEPQA